MDDEDLGVVTVADILKNPDRFVGETLSDPLEGPSYGRCKAMVMRDLSTGCIFINSFAHGGARYRLCYDRSLLEDLLRATDPKYVTDIFIARDAQSHIGPDDEVLLIALVSELSGIGKNPIKKKLKQDRDRRNREKCAEAEASRHSSIRPWYYAPKNDARIFAHNACS